jgi:hypothetical protein
MFDGFCICTNGRVASLISVYDNKMPLVIRDTTCNGWVRKGLACHGQGDKRKHGKITRNAVRKVRGYEGR